MMEQMFFGIYSQPWLQAMLGLRASDEPPRQNPGKDADHLAFVRRRIEELKGDMDKGGIKEAAIRAILYVRMPEGAADERGFEMLRRIREEHGAEKTLDEFKETLREQFFMLLIDERRAMEAIPTLIDDHVDEAPHYLKFIHDIVTAGGPLGEAAKKRLAKVKQMFGQQKTKADEQPLAEE